MDSKRALVRVLKGTFCKPKGRLYEPKRACVDFQVLNFLLQNRWLFGSSEIWNDKLKVYIIGTRSHGGDGAKRNVTEVPAAQRATEV